MLNDLHAQATKSVAELADILINASTCFDIWYELQNGAMRSIYQPVADNLPVFYETTLVSHLISMSVLLYSVQETRKDSHNLAGLLKLARAAYPGDERVEALETSASALKPVWQKVGSIRNEVFAHRRIGRAPSALFDKVQLQPQELRGLILGYQDLIGSVAELFEIDPPAFSLSALRDTQRAMLMLHDAIQP